MDFPALSSIGTPQCREWSSKIFTRHIGVDQFLKTRYIKTAKAQGYRYANNELRNLSSDLLFAGTYNAAMDDESIRDLARTRSIQSSGIYKAVAKVGDIPSIAIELEKFCDANEVEFPLSLSPGDTDKIITQKILSAAERVSDERWWRRQLRTVCGRKTEGVLRKKGFVREGRSPYVSNWALARWQASQARNRKTLSRMEAVTKDDNGDDMALDLQKCIDGSVANPVNRRNELMVRMRGYDEIAESMELTGYFLTLTCPSKYHAQLKRGVMNPKFNGSTPIDAMSYLNQTWARIRAAWGRKGIKTFGFRVTEPHHDGTPHFHFILFFNPIDKSTVLDIFERYALQEDGSEAGADKYRFDVVEIDPGKGRGAGYMAKYVAKNIDGFGIDGDYEGQCEAAEGAQRVRAWASMWGIRQFQQIGSVSVTVWRELRRRREILDDVTPEVVEELRSAADRGEWKEFVELMGGAMVGRDKQTLRPFYTESETQDSQYGEPVKKLIGVWLAPVVKALGRRFVCTRERVWKIREKDGLSLKREAEPPDLDLCQ